MPRVICRYSGNVQGVGFRYTARELAAGLEVRGYVRNLADGRVELVVEGAEEQIELYLDSVRRRMGDFIGGVDRAVAEETGEFSNFSVRH